MFQRDISFVAFPTEYPLVNPLDSVMLDPKRLSVEHFTRASVSPNNLPDFECCTQEIS